MCCVFQNELLENSNPKASSNAETISPTTSVPSDLLFSVSSLSFYNRSAKIKLRTNHQIRLIFSLASTNKQKMERSNQFYKRKYTALKIIKRWYRQICLYLFFVLSLLHNWTVYCCLASLVLFLLVQSKGTKLCRFAPNLWDFSKKGWDNTQNLGVRVG